MKEKGGRGTFSKVWFRTSRKLSFLSQKLATNNHPKYDTSSNERCYNELFYFSRKINDKRGLHRLAGRGTRKPQTQYYTKTFTVSLLFISNHQYAYSPYCFSIHFLRFWQGELVWHLWASWVGDHFLYSRDLHVWLRGDIVRRNWMLVILRSPSVKQRVVKDSARLVFCMCIH